MVRRAHKRGSIGEIQVPDVPGRCEPGTGEINYAAIARTLTDLGYRGTVASDSVAALFAQVNTGKRPCKIT
ncbi:MAG: hypothetical protein ACRDQ1_13785 [Sciscionella sp.]